MVQHGLVLLSLLQHLILAAHLLLLLRRHVIAVLGRSLLGLFSILRHPALRQCLFLLVELQECRLDNAVCPRSALLRKGLGLLAVDVCLAWVLTERSLELLLV